MRIIERLALALSMSDEWIREAKNHHGCKLPCDATLQENRAAIDEYEKQFAGDESARETLQKLKKYIEESPDDHFGTGSCPVPGSFSRAYSVKDNLLCMIEKGLS